MEAVPSEEIQTIPISKQAMDWKPWSEIKREVQDRLRWRITVDAKVQGVQGT